MNNVITASYLLQRHLPKFDSLCNDADAYEDVLYVDEALPRTRNGSRPSALWPSLSIRAPFPPITKEGSARTTNGMHTAVRTKHSGDGISALHEQHSYYVKDAAQRPSHHSIHARLQADCPQSLRGHHPKSLSIEWYQGQGSPLTGMVETPCPAREPSGRHDNNHWQSRARSSSTSQLPATSKRKSVDEHVVEISRRQIPNKIAERQLEACHVLCVPANYDRPRGEQQVSAQVDALGHYKTSSWHKIDPNYDMTTPRARAYYGPPQCHHEGTPNLCREHNIVTKSIDNPRMSITSLHGPSAVHTRHGLDAPTVIISRPSWAVQNHTFLTPVPMQRHESSRLDKCLEKFPRSYPYGQFLQRSPSKLGEPRPGVARVIERSEKRVQSQRPSIVEVNDSTTQFHEQDGCTKDGGIVKECRSDMTIVERQ